MTCLPQIPTVLLANKSDLSSQRSVTDDEVKIMMMIMVMMMMMIMVIMTITMITMTMSRCTRCPGSWASPRGIASLPETATTWTQRAT